MIETVIDTNTLQRFLNKMIPTEKVRVNEIDGIIQLMPVKENIDCTIGLHGILAEYDDMSVDKFLKRKLIDKELDS